MDDSKLSGIEGKMNSRVGWYHQTDVLERLKNHRVIASAMGFLGSGVTGAVVEYLMTGGTSGIVPIIAAFVGGIPVAIWLYFLGGSGGEENPGFAVQAAQGVERSQGDDGNRRKRFFTQWTVDEMVNEQQGKTSLSATATSRKHEGHWLRFTGPVFDVDEFGGEIRIPIDADVSGLVHTRFDKKRWAGQSGILRKGDVVTVVGRIQSTYDGGVSLTDCELERIEGASWSGSVETDRSG